MSPDPNLPHLERVVDRLGELAEDLMLVGGCAAGLLVTDPAAAQIRATEDVDLVVEAVSYPDYHAFCQRLLGRGLHQGGHPDAPICRWRGEGVILDVMPLDEAVLGFSNRWYRPALRAALRADLGGGRSLQHIDGPHFLASKLEAFHNRGEGDHLMSHDLEDLVVVVEGRPEIVTEVDAAGGEVRAFLAEGVAGLLADRFFMEALAGYFAGDGDAGDRARAALARLKVLAGRGA